MKNILLIYEKITDFVEILTFLIMVGLLVLSFSGVGIGINIGKIVTGLVVVALTLITGKKRLKSLEQGQEKLEQGQAKLEQGQEKLEQGQANINIRMDNIESRQIIFEKEIRNNQDNIMRAVENLTNYVKKNKL